MTTNERYIDVTLQLDNVDLDIELSQNKGGLLPPYEGEYTITPKIAEQVLATKNKTTTDNITVLAVPYSEVTNPQGGSTVNIAYIL